MKRKNYEKPTIEVVLVRPTEVIQSSGVKAERSDYGAANKNVSTSEKEESGVWKWY